MARVPNKHNRDQNLDFQGFLSDLQDWELSVKEKDKKLKAQSHEERNKTGGNSRNNGQQFNYSRNSEAINSISSKFFTEESSPDAASEKELGNEYFKQKKFKEAVDCYSRSIALSPTAVAFANRAMAYLKLKKFKEAETDCTEALNLDDRYIKAYSRRATARKELGKLKESFEDSEFALRLEPQNQELKKQYAEAKALYDKELLAIASKVVRKSSAGEKEAGGTAVKADTMKPLVTAMEMEKGSARAAAIREQNQDLSNESQLASSGLCNSKNGGGVSKKEVKPSIQDLALRAASQAMAEAAKNLRAPKTAYEFEVSWRGLSGNRALQARLLKTISPAALPKLFRDALSTPLLVDIVKCIATFFSEEIELAVELLDNLAKVSRFGMITMCLSTADKADLHKIWEEVFSNEAVPIGCADTLSKLRTKYCSGI